MGDRTTTNILLAIIAGVLLFGSSAVTGVIKWIALVGGALLLIYAVFAFLGYLVRTSIKAISEAKAHGPHGVIAVVFGIVTMCFLPVLGGHILLLWLDGVPKPLEVASHSWIGATWLGIIISYVAALAAWQLFMHRSDIVPATRYVISLLVRSPLAPLFLSMHGWRKARASGDGMISSTVTALFGLLIGLIIWGILAAIFLPLFGL